MVHVLTVPAHPQLDLDLSLNAAQVEDHNPPHLGQIFAFLERAGLFGAEDPENVVAV